jgi:hypothetical protein
MAVCFISKRLNHEILTGKLASSRLSSPVSLSRSNWVIPYIHQKRHRTVIFEARLMNFTDYIEKTFLGEECKYIVRILADIESG